MNSYLVLNCRGIKRLASDPLYRNSFFMAFGNVFNAGCGFLFWMVAARLYTVEQAGLATALISSLGLLLIFSKLGFDYSIIRFSSSEDRRRVIGTSLTITTTFCIFAGAIFILLAGFISPALLFLSEPRYAMAFLLIGAASSVVSIIGVAFVASRKADYCLFQNLFLALRIPLLIPLAFLGVFGIFGSLGLGYLFASCFGLMALQRGVISIPIRVDFDFIKRSFRFTSWNYVSSMLSAAPNLIIPIIILNILGEAEAARYYIAFTICGLAFIIPDSLGTSLFVEGSHGEVLKNSVFRAGGASLTLLVPVVLVLFLFGDRILELPKEEYVQAFDLLKIIALSSFPVAIYSLFIPIQNVRMRVESIVMLNALRCTLLLGLSYILMLWYGILGAGYAWLTTYLILALAIGWMVMREGWI